MHGTMNIKFIGLEFLNNFAYKSPTSNFDKSFLPVTVAVMNTNRWTDGQTERQTERRT